MLSMIVLLADLGLFLATIVAFILVLFGKLDIRIPLVMLGIFMVSVISIMAYEMKHAITCDENGDRLIFNDDNKPENSESPSHQKDA